MNGPRTLLLYRFTHSGAEGKRRANLNLLRHGLARPSSGTFLVHNSGLANRKLDRLARRSSFSFLFADNPLGVHQSNRRA